MSVRRHVDLSGKKELRDAPATIKRLCEEQL